MLVSYFLAILSALHERGVDFIVVGGLSATLSGAPINTFDVDIVHSREAANVERLLSVLESFDAIFRIQPHRRLRPGSSHVSGPGHLNLLTRLGPLDVLGTIGSGLTYADLLPHSGEMEIAGGIRVRVLNLEKLIALKEELGREKDLAVLPILRRTL